jgi:hypothetical protein
MGGSLVSKLVKPTKIFCSRPPYQSGFGQVVPSKTKADIGTATAGVLREADPTVGQELRRLDSPDRIFDQLAEFASLLVRDRGTKVLNLYQPLADEDHLGHLGDAGDQE